MTSNIETVQKIYAAFGAGDVPTILSYLDPEVEWEHDWGTAPPALYQRRVGREAVAGFFDELSNWAMLVFEPTNFLEGGNQVAVPIRLEMRHKATGKVVKDLEMHLFTFGTDGAVQKMRHVLDARAFAEIEAMN